MEEERPHALEVAQEAHPQEEAPAQAAQGRALSAISALFIRKLAGQRKLCFNRALRPMQPAGRLIITAHWPVGAITAIPNH